MMKKIMLIGLLALPLFAVSQTKKELKKEKQARKDSIESADTVEYSFFNPLFKNGQIELDSTIYTGQSRSVQKRNIKMAAAEVYTSLPNVMKYEDDSTIIIHANNGDKLDYEQIFHIKKDSVRVIARQFITSKVQWGNMPEQQAVEYWYKILVENSHSPKERIRKRSNITNLTGVVILNEVSEIYNISLKMADAGPQ